MSDVLAIESASDDLSCLPATSLTRGGVEFYPNDDVWTIRDGVARARFNFTYGLELVTPQVKFGLKASLVWLLRNKALATASNTFASFKHMLAATGRTESDKLNEISHIDLLSYRASLTKNQMNRLRTLAILLTKWHGLGIAGVRSDAISLLHSLKLRAPPKGTSVLTMCPVHGPLTQIEDESFQEALNSAFARGFIEEDEFFAVWLTRAIGQRPSQTASLKVCDLAIEKQADGSMEYLISVPRAKQRHSTHPRSEWKVRPLIQQLGDPLHTYLLKVTERFQGIVPDPLQAPLFPRHTRPGTEGIYAWHLTGNEMSALFHRVSDRVNALSERTGAILRVTPTRLRRTVGTRAAQEGHGELLIAEILDHTNVASARFYVEAVPAIIARIDAAMAHGMAPLARAFQGLQPETFDSASVNSSELIFDLRFDQKGQSMGQCTGSSPCNFLAPISCYTCRSFRPWRDGPHQEVLDELIARRDKQMALHGARMASINDRTMLAVAEVIQICETQHEKK